MKTTRLKYLFFTLFLLTQNLFTQDVQQTRALWVTRWDYQSADDIRAIVANAAACHFNLIFFQVRGNGTVAYSSLIEPWAEEFSMQHPGWDPLKTAVESAHAQNLQLHAWINVYPAWRGGKPPDHPDQLCNLHPTWLMRDQFGGMQSPGSQYIWLSPTHPDVQNYLLTLCAEIYKNYPIDGLHLDYIRYPGSSYSYDSASLELFRNLTGTDPFQQQEQWNEWRREAITGLISRLYQTMTEFNPRLILSAAVMADYAHGNRVMLQDSHGWLAKGVVDMIFPMIYTQDSELFRRQLMDHRLNDHGRHVYPGIYARNPSQILEQIQYVRDVGCKGLSVFSYQLLFPNHKPCDMVLAALAQVWHDIAAPVDLPWKSAQLQDNQGPVITQVNTIPTDFSANKEFKIAARIIDPSGVHDDNSGSEGQGIYLVYDRNWPPTEGIEIKMSPVANSKDWYITDRSIAPQRQGLDFRCRIFAWDDCHDASQKPKRNMGYSDIWSLSILLPNKSYVSGGTFGPELNSPRGVEVDANGKIWISSADEQPVRIYLSDGREAAFSPLQTGLTRDGVAVPIRSAGALAFMAPDIMCLVSNQDTPVIFRYNIHTGQPLPGIAVDFNIGNIACDGKGNIFALENGNTIWHVLTSTGLELEGSPFGTRQIANDIAVLGRGELVFVSNRSTNTVQCWQGKVDGLQADYRQVKDLSAVDIGFGKVHVSRSNHVYVAHSQRGIISVFDRSGKTLLHLSGGVPLLLAPVEIATTVSGDTLYVLENVGEGPTKLSLWVRKRGK